MVTRDFMRVLIDSPLSLPLGLALMCLMMADCARAAPSSKTVQDDFVSKQTDQDEPEKYCAFALDPRIAAIRAGYAVEDVSLKRWKNDQMTPPGSGIYEYDGSFFGPEYSDTSGPAFNPYDVASYNATSETIAQKICVMIGGWLRCFRKKDPPVDAPRSPPAKTPRDIEAEDKAEKARCAALAQAAYVACVSCGCPRCDIFAEHFVYRWCTNSDDPPSIHEANQCALDCLDAHHLPMS